MAPPGVPASLPVGVWLFPSAPADRLVEAVVRAEEVGLDEVWLADEGVAREPMVILAAAARETSRITLGVGITSPVLRHPGALAATASTIDELSGGRFVLGLGVGGEKSLGPFELEADRPVERLADAIATARAVLAGRPLPDGPVGPIGPMDAAAGPGRRAGSRLGGPGGGSARYRPPEHAAPARPVPIWVGARGPRLLQLAAGQADGIFVSGCSPDQHRRVAGIVARARAAGHRAGVALYQSASGSPDTIAARSACGWDQVGAVLATECRRMIEAAAAPTSIGINLVDLIAAEVDPVGAVERAAEVLARR